MIKPLNEIIEELQHTLSNKKWKCKNCGAYYAEYINGCPKCCTGEAGGSHSVIPALVPITLEDVLKALGERFEEITTKTWGKKMEIITFRRRGEKSIPLNKLVKSIDNYLIGLPLPEQPEATLRGIYDLIFKK